MSADAIERVSGATAAFAALQDLYVHFVIATAIAATMALLAVMADLLAKRPTGDGIQHSFSARLRYDVVDYGLYCGAFALFGVVTAYFLALGLNAGNEDEVNSLVSTFATPFVSLLTAGVAFVAAKSKTQITSNELVLGVLSFLVACVLSYHTHTKQRFEYTGTIPEAVSVQDAGAATRRSNEEPVVAPPAEEGPVSPASSLPPPSPDAATDL